MLANFSTEDRLLPAGHGLTPKFDKFAMSHGLHPTRACLTRVTKTGSGAASSG